METASVSASIRAYVTVARAPADESSVSESTPSARNAPHPDPDENVTLRGVKAAPASREASDVE